MYLQADKKPVKKEMEVMIMALSNLAGWKKMAEPVSSCGSACGAGDK